MFKFVTLILPDRRNIALNKMLYIELMQYIFFLLTFDLTEKIANLKRFYHPLLPKVRGHQLFKCPPGSVWGWALLETSSSQSEASSLVLCSVSQGLLLFITC